MGKAGRHRRRWLYKFVIAGTACLLMLLFFGTGGASASAPVTTNHAVATFDLADHNVAVDKLAANTFSDGRAAWEIRTIAEQQTMLAIMVDETAWHTTTQLDSIDVLSIAAVQQRNEWSTWMDESGVTLANEHETIATTNTVPAAGDLFFWATRIDPQQTGAVMPRSVVGDFVTTTGYGGNSLLE